MCLVCGTVVCSHSYCCQVLFFHIIPFKCDHLCLFPHLQPRTFLKYFDFYMFSFRLNLMDRVLVLALLMLTGVVQASDSS